MSFSLAIGSLSLFSEHYNPQRIPRQTGRSDRELSEAAAKAALDAQEQLSSVENNWAEVRNASEPIKERGRVNHFTESVEQALRFRRRG